MSSSELGTLVVVVLKARNLNDKHFWKQDVYAKISLPITSSPSPLVKSTQVDVKGGQHPVWDEEIRMSVSRDAGAANKNRVMEVTCWSKEHKNDDLLGTGTIDISDTLRTGEFDDWIKLEIDGVSRGEIYLEMTFYANAPPPLTRRVTKMNPKERLWRPPQVANTSPRGNHLGLPAVTEGGGRPPPLSKTQIPASLATGKPSVVAGLSSPFTNSRPIAGSNASRPVFPESGGSPPLSKAYIPPSLAAGGGARHTQANVSARPHSNSNANQTIPAPALGGFPSILRPGPRTTGPATPGSAPSSPPLGFIQPNYTAGPTGYPPPPVRDPTPQTRTSPPQRFAQPSYVTAGPTGFPPPPIRDPVPQGRISFPEARTGAAPFYISAPAPAEPALPDPYLIARYHTPLPLPADGSGAPPALPPRNSYGQSPPRRDPAKEAAEIAKREEEADRRRRAEQEDADAELARRLDAELNAEGGGDEHMPGQW